MGTNLRHAAGSLIVVGLAGTELSALERAWLKLVRPGGVILFRRNIADAAQTRALLQGAASLSSPHALRCVDLEGGTVDRLRDALAPMPAAQYVARADSLSKTRSSRFALRHGTLIAKAVKTFGFNVTLAPVLDLALPDSADVMGTRSTGSTAEEVVAYARPFLTGLASQRIAGCAKHFPGLGGGTRDSHFETPAIQREWKELWSEDIAPYRALKALLPMVMVNHAAYPATRGNNLPATASPFWITAVLRKRIGYRGLIFSDDMEMGGILQYMPMEEAAITTVRAGMDTMEICHSPELILRAYEALITEAEKSAAFRKLLLARAQEAARKRARIAKDGFSRPLTPVQYELLRKQIHTFREKVLAIVGETAAVPSGSRLRPIAEAG